MAHRASALTVILVAALAQLGCAREAAGPATPEASTTEQVTKAPSTPPVAAAPSQPIQPAAKPEPKPKPGPKKIGCWERAFGKPPAAEALGPSLPAAVPGCEGCETLKLGPNAAGLHVEVLRRLQKLVAALPPPEVDEPVLWINSGKRSGDPDDSMHNQGLGIDAVICGLDTRGTGAKLRAAGFTCVIEYYDGAGNPCHFAHADLRTDAAAVGAYAKGGRKARTCPKKARSKTMDCSNSTKRDWTYSEG
jgi:hypothetical protein